MSNRQSDRQLMVLFYLLFGVPVLFLTAALNGWL